MTQIAASVSSMMAGSIWNNILPVDMIKRVPGEYNCANIAGHVVYIMNLPEDKYYPVVEGGLDIVRWSCLLSCLFSCSHLFLCISHEEFRFGRIQREKEIGRKRLK